MSDSFQQLIHLILHHPPVGIAVQPVHGPDAQLPDSLKGIRHGSQSAVLDIGHANTVLHIGSAHLQPVALLL